MEEAGLEVSLVEDDAEIWHRQREGQRSPAGVAVRVSTLPSRFADLMQATRRLGGRSVARAGLGLAWVVFEDRSARELADAVAELRRAMDPAPCAVLDAPAEVRRLIAPWPRPAEGPLGLMQRLKQRFDPAGICRPALA
jgi:FAD/FMN-containing dehydrogenase